MPPVLSAFFVVADVPASVTIVVAFLTGAFGVVGGVITAKKQSESTLAAAHEQAEATVRSAQEQSGASVLNAESGRFAAWQMHKRDIYAEFLGAARAVTEVPVSQDARAAYLAEADRVMLVASKDLRDHLEPLIRDPGCPRTFQSALSLPVPKVRLCRGREVLPKPSGSPMVRGRQAAV